MKQFSTVGEFKFNETYSSLKKSCSILYKELSKMKEKNKHLKQRLEELELNLSLINKRTITKEEMKEMLKEGLASITNVPIGKEEVNAEKRTDNTKKAQRIKSIEEVMQSKDLDTDVIYALAETEDKRIASGGENCDLSISSYDLKKKKWKRDIHKKSVHKFAIFSLCALNGNRLLSSSKDYSIKVWSLSEVELTLIKDIKAHTNFVNEVIPLSKGSFASCSCDNTVKIWKDNNTYECISTLQHNDWVSSILQLKGKDVLVSCGFSATTGVSFWNINDCAHLHTIKGYGVVRSTYMIELADGNIALSFYVKPCPIVIIDSSSYQVKTKIQLEEHNTHPSSLCILDEHSFIHVHKGSFLQISNKGGSVLFQSEGGKFDGWSGVIPLEGGKYFAVQNNTKISIIKPCYV